MLRPGQVSALATKKHCVESDLWLVRASKERKQRSNENTSLHIFSA